MTRCAATVLLLAVGAWSWPAAARADVILIPPVDVFPEEACRTQSTRSAEQILGAQVADAHGNAGPALSVVAGETLCVQVERMGGRVTGLRVLASSAGAADLLRVRLTQNDGNTMLALAIGSDRLHYRVGRAMGARPELLEIAASTVDAPRIDFNSWPSRIDELVLFDLRIEPIPAPPPGGEPEPATSRAWIGAALGAGLYVNQLDELNDAFEQQGYTRVSSLQPLGAFSVDLAFARVHLALAFAVLGSRTFERVADGAEFDLGQVIASFEVGYVLYQLERLQLLGGLGISAGDIHFEIDPEAPAILPDQFGAEDEPEEIRRNAYALHLQVGADYRWPLFSDKEGLLFSARLGYAQQLGQESFVHEDASLPGLRGGPSLDTSGPFGRLLVGVFAEF